MRRSVRLWGWALAASLLLHLGLLGGLEWRLPQWASPPEPPAIDVQLVPAPAPAVVAVPPPRSAPVLPKPPASRPPLPRPSPIAVAPPPEPTTEPAAEAAAPEAPAIHESAGSMATIQPSPLAAAPVEPASADTPPVLNALPPRIDLRFQVRYGLASGEQTLVWVNDGEHYTLTSVVGATGLTGVFYRGRFVQTSRGLITPNGLQPEEFWDQRGDRLSSARFDAMAGQITLLPEKGAPRHFAYRGAVQDALSLFFQFALTAPPPEGQQTYRVFNGKKLRDYAYEVRGEETLETELGTLRTLHLARVADSDGRFEAWLAIDRHYLPVRVLRSDDKGREMELRVQSITP